MNSKTVGFLSLLAMLGTALMVVLSLDSALIPITIAAFLAYLLLPLVRRLEAIGVKKEIAVTAAILLTAAFWGVALTLLIPALLEDAKNFITHFPSFIASALDRLIGSLESWD